MFAHKWYIGTNDAIDLELVRNKIDEYLKILNDDYRVERIAAIRDVKVEILPVETFYEFLRRQGKEGGQNKFPRVLRNEKITQWDNFLTEIKGKEK